MKQIIYFFLGKSLQQKWKNIKTSFYRELKLSAGAKSGSAALHKSPYIYFEQLQFLSKTMVNNATQTSTNEIDVKNNNENDNVQIRSPVTKKKKKNDNKSLIEVLNQSISTEEDRNRNQECDSDGLFMISLLKDLKMIPEHRRLSTKIELMNVIKRDLMLSLEIKNQSFSQCVPGTSTAAPYNHRCESETSNSCQCYHGNCIQSNCGLGAWNSDHYHYEHSTQQNYDPRASTSGRNCVHFTPVSEEQKTMIDEGLSPTASNVTNETENSEIHDLYNI